MTIIPYKLLYCDNYDNNINNSDGNDNNHHIYDHLNYNKIIKIKIIRNTSKFKNSTTQFPFLLKIELHIFQYELSFFYFSDSALNFLHHIL